MPITPVALTGPAGPVSPAALRAGEVAGAGGDESFAAALVQGLEGVQQLHATEGTLAVQAATGDLQDVHDYMIAASQASTATQLTVAIRDRALTAYNEIMRMPV